MLCEALGDACVAVREPGGTAVGERVRELLKDPALVVGPETEVLLFAAARAELVARVIRPALTDGRVVVCDRFLDSSLAYQGAARGIGVEAVARINEIATGGLEPDLTFLLSIEPGAAAIRSGHADRFEEEGGALQEAVLRGYEQIATGERWRRVDAARAPEEVHREVLAVVREARS